PSSSFKPNLGLRDGPPFNPFKSIAFLTICTYFPESSRNSQRGSKSLFNFLAASYSPALTCSYSFCALFGAIFAATETHPVAPCTNDSYARSSEPQKNTKPVLLIIALTLRISPLDSLMYWTLSSSLSIL